jgi:hypothetical protein
MRGQCPDARRTSPLELGPLVRQGADLRLELVDLVHVLLTNLVESLLRLLLVDGLVPELVLGPLDCLAVRGLDRAQVSELPVDLLQ